MNQLDALKALTTVVADTGNFRQLAQYAPRDATTNPSLILKAVQQPDYAPLLADVVAAHRDVPIDAVVDRILVRFGLEILKMSFQGGSAPKSMPGCRSTQRRRSHARIA